MLHTCLGSGVFRVIRLRLTGSWQLELFAYDGVGVSLHLGFIAASLQLVVSVGRRAHLASLEGCCCVPPLAVLYVVSAVPTFAGTLCLYVTAVGSGVCVVAGLLWWSAVIGVL